MSRSVEKVYVDLGKDGSKWKHDYIPLNAVATAMKLHKHGKGGSGGTHQGTPEHQAKLAEHGAERKTLGQMKVGDHIVNVRNGKRTRVTGLEPSSAGKDYRKMTLAHGETTHRHVSTTYDVAKSEPLKGNALADALTKRSMDSRQAHADNVSRRDLNANPDRGTIKAGTAVQFKDQTGATRQGHVWSSLGGHHYVTVHNEKNGKNELHDLHTTAKRRPETIHDGVVDTAGQKKLADEHTRISNAEAARSIQYGRPGTVKGYQRERSIESLNERANRQVAELRARLAAKPMKAKSAPKPKATKATRSRGLNGPKGAPEKVYPQYVTSGKR